MCPRRASSNKIEQIMTDWAVDTAEHLPEDLDDDSLELELKKIPAYVTTSHSMDDYFYVQSLSASDCAEILVSMSYPNAEIEDEVQFKWPTAYGSTWEYLIAGVYYAMKKWLSTTALEQFTARVREAYSELTRQRLREEDDGYSMTEEEAYATRGGDSDRERFTSD